MWCAECLGQSLAYIQVLQECFYKKEKRERGTRQGARFLDPDNQARFHKMFFGTPYLKAWWALLNSDYLCFPFIRVFPYNPEQLRRNWPSPWTPYIILTHPFTCPFMNSLAQLLSSSHTHTHTLTGASLRGPLCWVLRPLGWHRQRLSLGEKVHQCHATGVVRKPPMGLQFF